MQRYRSGYHGVPTLTEAYKAVRAVNDRPMPAHLALLYAREKVADAALLRDFGYDNKSVGDPDPLDRHTFREAIEVLYDVDGIVRWHTCYDDDTEHLLDFDCCEGDEHGPHMNEAGDRCPNYDWQADACTQPCIHKCRELHEINQNGAQGYTLEVLHPLTHKWEHFDSCWGYIGDPNKDHDLDHEIANAMRYARRLHDEAMVI